jgi:hypothetical protein
MRTKYHYRSKFTRGINTRRIEIGKLHCPKCFSKEVFADLNDECACRDCYQKFEFKNLLNFTQVRDKKIDTILS